ncbi:type II toxin-antitoxin system RelE/ParE family toxin, partial [uncultured Dubosiella sp.]
IIYSWIEKYLMNCDDPRIYGKALVGDKAGMWRYRVGTYRIICDIKDHEFLIVAIRIGHRKNVYK